MTQQSYREAATNTFNGLISQYAGANVPASYWVLGHAFDSLLDYYDVIDPRSTSADSVAQSVQRQYQNSLKNLGGYDAAWFDDFGWWTVATQRAMSRSYFSSSTKSQLFLPILTECWKRYTGNAPFVWERRGSDRFANYGPVVSGGIWNEYWFGTDASYAGPKDGDPSAMTLHGIQNTVSNALYWIAAQRFAVTTSPDAGPVAENAYRFFRGWFEMSSNPLWWQQGPNAALVRERVSHFAQATYPEDFLAKWATWAWVGDQGLILGALVDRLSRALPGEQGPLLARARQLMVGVSSNLVGSDKTLKNWTTDNVPDGDTTDYSTGKAVFWRNVLYTARNNAELRAFLPQSGLLPVLLASADRVVGFPSIDIIGATNDLATLVTASALLE